MGDGAGAADAAAAAAASTTRRRPLIYVYDLPPAYNSRLLQYRNEKCAGEGGGGLKGGQRLDHGVTNTCWFAGERARCYRIAIA